MESELVRNVITPTETTKPVICSLDYCLMVQVQE